MNNTKKESMPRAIIFVGMAIGLLLLLIGSGLFSSDKTDVSATMSYDEREYEEELIKKIENICGKVRGVGSISVAVTLDGSYKAVFADNSKSYVHSESQPIGYSAPKILGIGIVCEGGNDARVQREVISLLSATFCLPTNKIYVTAS